MDTDIEQPILPSISKDGTSTGEIGGVQEPLLKNESNEYEEYSVVSAILPFLFPVFGGLLYGYDIGATSSATISIQELLGAGAVFFIFGGIAILSLIFIFFYIPETKGLTLEEIEAKLL